MVGGERVVQTLLFVATLGSLNGALGCRAASLIEPRQYHYTGEPDDARLVAILRIGPAHP